MITKDGYSKDASIIPDGIVITWSKDVVNQLGGMRPFIRQFNKVMQDGEGLWFHNCRMGPKQENYLQFVYIIFNGRVRYRCNYVGYEMGRILMAGPAAPAPLTANIERKGFRGFRYCTQLF